MSDSTPKMQDYEETYRTARLDVPEYFNFALDVVDRWADDHTKLALVSVDPTGQTAEHHTFWDLKVLSNRFANLLKGLGVANGDRVFIMLPRISQWYVAMLGLMKVGAVPMPATTLCTPRDIEYRITQADAIMAITDPENASKVEEVAGGCPTLQHLLMVGESRRGWLNYDEMIAEASQHLEEVERTRSDDPLLIQFTPGTVGYPKMRLHPHASYGRSHVLTTEALQD